MIPTVSTPAQVQVLGVNQVVFETDPKKRRRRRRRRNNQNNNYNNDHNNGAGKPGMDNHRGHDDDCHHHNMKNNHNHHHDDSSTCSATVSSDSLSSGDFHHLMEEESSACSSPLVQQPHPRFQNMKQPTKGKQPRRPKKQQQQYRQQQHQQNEQVSWEEQARYVGLDCEMVGVGPGGHHSSIARVTLVAWDGTILLDEFVKQDQPVTDYRTFVSGVTELDLETAAWGLDDIRRRVEDMIADKILVGHALKNDMRALGITHPWYNVRDTAKYEPFMHVRFVEDGILWPRKLKDLVKEKLHREIQRPGEAHSSYEDAVAAMDLYRLVRRKWEKAMDYKIKKTREIESKKQ